MSKTQQTSPCYLSPESNLLTSDLITGGSDSQLNVLSKQSESCNLSRRVKRKLDSDLDDITSAIMPQITALFESFEKKQSLRMESLITAITEQNSEMKNSVEFLSQKYDDFLDRMELLEHENAYYKKKITVLESKIEHFERNSRLSLIEIKNVPKVTHENKEILHNIVNKLGETIGQPITRLDIRDIYRLKTKNDSGSHIVVDFTTTTTKTTIVKKCREYNKNNKNNRLNTSDIGISSKPQPIYVDEALTQLAKRLFYLAREFVKINNNYICWTSYCKVYIKEKNNDKAPVLRIDSEEDIRKLECK